MGVACEKNPAGQATCARLALAGIYVGVALMRGKGEQMCVCVCPSYAHFVFAAGVAVFVSRGQSGGVLSVWGCVFPSARVRVGLSVPSPADLVPSVRVCVGAGRGCLDVSFFFEVKSKKVRLSSFYKQKEKHCAYFSVCVLFTLFAYLGGCPVARSLGGFGAALEHLGCCLHRFTPGGYLPRQQTAKEVF